MSDQSQKETIRVGLIAPSGIGKTSIIASLLAEAKTVLSGSPVQIKAVGKTKKIMNELDQKLRTHIRGRAFVVGGIPGNETAVKMELSVGLPDLNEHLYFEFLDYPGGWLTNPDGASEADWKKVEDFLISCDTIILPLDSPLIMEWTTPNEDLQVSSEINLEAVQDVIESWCKKRNPDKSMLFLTPVKCEHYLNDNGGRQDKSTLLESRCIERTAPLLKSIVEENPQTKVLYCPIDTMGCVQLKRVNFRKTPPDSRFSIRGKDPQLSRKGAGDIFVYLIDHYFSKAEAERAKLQDKLASDAKDAVNLAQRDEGFFGNIWNYITGEQSRRELDAESKSGLAQGQAEALKTFVETLEGIRKLRPSNRLKEL